METICKIEPNIDVSLYIEFTDGIKGIVSFTTEFLNKGSFHAPLKDFSFFRLVQEDDLNMLMWPNGFGISKFEVYEWLKTDNGLVYIV